MEQAKISIITVCYNSCINIEKTIKSVLSQNYDNIEYIIIDGKSTDGTIEIIQKYSNNIDIIISEPDNGIYDAMNKGIKHSSGEWLMFMNAGDTYISSDSLKNFISNLTEGIRILRGNIIRIYPNFKTESTGITKQEPGIMDMFNGTFHHQASLIQKTLFDEFGYYSTQYRLMSDWKFFFDCVILHNQKTKYVDFPVAYFAMDGASTINTIKYRKEQLDYLTQIYGSELVEVMNEVSIIRKNKVLSLYCNLYTKAINSMSSKVFNRLLTLKRCLKKIIGLKNN